MDADVRASAFAKTGAHGLLACLSLNALCVVPHMQTEDAMRCDTRFPGSPAWGETRRRCDVM